MQILQSIVTNGRVQYLQRHDGKEMPMGYNTTDVYHVFMYVCKVDYMMVNAFMYATTT